MINANNRIVLGAENPNGNDGFNGSIDEFGIWDRVLEGDEVEQLYNAGFGINPINDVAGFAAPISFDMGSPSGEDSDYSDEYLHRVLINRSFVIKKTEVTQAEYFQLMETNPSHFQDCPDCPVEMVTWNDAILYCNALSVSDGLAPAYFQQESEWIWDQSSNGWRLPTEAEWEYACRASSSTPFNTGHCLDADNEANYQGSFPFNNCSDGADGVGPKSVMSYNPNAAGLFDMHGNVWEWCWDRYSSTYYVDDMVDPTGPTSGTNRIFRGGCWNSKGHNCRSARRDNSVATFEYLGLGFRLARTASIPTSSVPDRIEALLHSAVPNPFNPITTLSFDLQRPEKVELQIFDIAGRHMKTLINSQNLPAGTHAVKWNGRDQQDRRVAAGVYFYHLKAGSYNETKRMVLVK